MLKRLIPILAIGTLALAQAAAQQTTIKRAPAQHTPAASGQQMFDSYCAVCHGKGGTGNGPAAAALKIPPANLTLLAQKNGGTFPAEHVTGILQGAAFPAHGSKDMPIWGPVLSSVSNGPQESRLRVYNLMEYVKSLQK